VCVRKLNLTVVLVLCGWLAACSDPIQQAHVDANVPPARQFQSLLKRDLERFFSDRRGSTVAVSYELLRDAPTQSGIAYPKYYVWVRAEDAAKLVEEVAVRVAAIDRTRFQITDFVSTREIQRNALEVDKIFPKALVPDIVRRAGVR
jgi:hypothetical protein